MDRPTRGETPREKRLKKLLKHISKSDLQTQRFNNYVRQRSRTVTLRPSANKSRKRKQSENADFDSEEEEVCEDRKTLPNYASLSLRESYLRNSSRSATTNVSSGCSSVLYNDNITISPGLSPGVSKTHSTPTNSMQIHGIDKLQHTNNAAKDTPKGKKADSCSLWPTVSFADIGGLDSVLNKIAMMFACLLDPVKFQVFSNWTCVENFLLQGPSGCGKTLIAHAIGEEFQLPVIKISATEIVTGISGESEKMLRNMFDRAVLCMPCVLFIDEIDAIVPKRETAERELSKRIVTQLINCMDELKAKNASVVIIGATNRPHALDPALRAAGRFDQEFYVGIPDAKARLEILKIIHKKLKFSPGFNLQWLVENTPGYVGADLSAICKQAIKNAVQRMYLDEISTKENELQPEPKTSEISCRTLASLWRDKSGSLCCEQLDSYSLEQQDFESVLKSYTPSTKREGFPDIPSITWEEVGALKDVKTELQEAVVWPVKYKEKFGKCHIGSCSGILLCGPKGCGKTLIAQAVANECRLNFLSIKGPELLSMYLGESEKAVRECFEKARRAAPCVIFFDEIDAICPVRSSHGHNPAANSIVCMMLAEMDGIKKKDQQIFIMGTTNRPNDIDGAMLRPGRLERIIYVGVPDQSDRHDILRTITKNGTEPKLADDVNLETLSSDGRCARFSGADLASLVRRASLIAFKEHLEEREPSEYVIKMEHFDSAFAVVEPSISERDFKCFKDIKSGLHKPQFVEPNQTFGKTTASYC